MDPILSIYMESIDEFNVLVLSSAEKLGSP